VVLMSVIALKIQLRLDQVVRYHWGVGRSRFGIGRLADLERRPKIGPGLQIGSANRVPSPKTKVSLLFRESSSNSLQALEVLWR
jgi:hypothetical protein